MSHMPHRSPSESYEVSSRSDPGSASHRLSLIGLSLKTSLLALPFVLLRPRSGHLRISAQAVARLAIPHHRILLVIRGLPAFAPATYPQDRLWVLTPTHFVALWHTPTYVHSRFIDRHKITSLTSKVMPDQTNLDLTLKAGVVHLHLSGAPATALAALRSHFSLRRRSSDRPA